MTGKMACLLWIGILAFSFPFAHGQDPRQLIQQAVDAEREADQNDHSQWIYLEEIREPKEHVLQWVATTPQGDVQRVLEENNQRLTESQQRELVQKFLHDLRAQRKQVAEIDHDTKQIDDLLKLLPNAFVWTQTLATTDTTSLRFEPAPNFHPPTREARVFSNMSGDLTVDNQQHRIRNIEGRLNRDVTFGGGILGKLKKGSSFSLEQKQVGPALWQLTAMHIHLQGNAFLFKSVSLEEDDERSRFAPESFTITLDQAAIPVMSQPQVVSPEVGNAPIEH